MRIRVHSKEGKNINLAFPTRMLFNGVTASIACAAIKKHVQVEGVETLSGADLRKLVLEINRLKRRFGTLDLVDIDGKDGACVRIRL